MADRQSADDSTANCVHCLTTTEDAESRRQTAYQRSEATTARATAQLTHGDTAQLTIASVSSSVLCLHVNCASPRLSLCRVLSFVQPLCLLDQVNCSVRKLFEVS
jgi:hypothetical protein